MNAASKTIKLNSLLKNSKSGDGMISKTSTIMSREASTKNIQPSSMRQLIKLSTHGKARAKLNNAKEKQFQAQSLQPPSEMTS